MPTNNRNLLSREAYLKTINHPRKKQLATMILDGATAAEFVAADFARLNVLEAVRDVRSNVEGQEGLSVDIPRGTGMDSSSADDIARSASTDNAEKKDSPTPPSQDEGSQASVPAQPVGDSTPDAASDIIPNENANMTDEHTAPSGDEVPGVTADEPTANPTETVGGNPVGTLTGEEDAETLQRKADEEAEANKGDAS